MISYKLQKAAREVNIILENIVPEEYVLKIPKKIIKFLKENEDVNYIFDVDIDKNIDEQNISETTKDLIALIYRNYWCNEKEKIELDKILTENERLYQEALPEKIGIESLFKERKSSNNQENITNIETKETSLVEIKSSNFFIKIFDKIKKLFKKNYR